MKPRHKVEFNNDAQQSEKRSQEGVQLLNSLAVKE